MDNIYYILPERAFIDAFLTLFIVFDAIGNIPIFYSLTTHLKLSEKIRVFTRSVIIASFLLVFFMFFGKFFLDYYKVTLNDFKIAGGILLLIIAIEGIFGRVEAEMLRGEDIAIVPMATPLLAGPGSIYVVMYLYTRYGLLPTLFSIVANSLFAFILLKYSNFLLSKLGKNVILVFSRIMSFLLSVIAVTMLREGIIAFFS